MNENKLKVCVNTVDVVRVFICFQPAMLAYVLAYGEEYVVEVPK